MAKVKKMAFGGIGGFAKPVMGKPMTKPVIAPKPVKGNPVMSGIKPLPPGSIGFPGGPGGKTVYNKPLPPGSINSIGRPTPPPSDPANPFARTPNTSKPFIPTPPVMGNPVNPGLGLVPKNDPFFKSKEFKDFEARGGPATMDMYNSPYFGSIGSGSVGRAQDEAYRKFKNIPEPTPEKQYGNSPSSGRLGLGSLIGSMKKGDAVKTQAKKMASGGVTSSASKRGDGIAQRGKTKGRMR